jgi:hypothetical protein
VDECEPLPSAHFTYGAVVAFTERHGRATCCSPRYRMPLTSKGRATYCSPRYRMPLTSRNEVSICFSMRWRAVGLADIAHHVIGCHLSQETMIQIASDVVASNIC